ncbi:hypothetical protein EDD11_000224 [Mortierella claussenii]|nr:hypothetical protein EDD11_000224 [Mortierella claussenii]
MLPTEIWILILDHIPTLDLFSLYNTSKYMRTMTAPFLVQAMASKSLRLYFYQEYVRRVGIKFVFDHFDLARDRIVFRPQTRDHQHRFRCGLTLQNPQLEEVAVSSSSSMATIAQRDVQCSEGRYYTICRKSSSSLKEQTLKTATVDALTLPIAVAEGTAAAAAAAAVETASAIASITETSVADGVPPGGPEAIATAAAASADGAAVAMEVTVAEAAATNQHGITEAIDPQRRVPQKRGSAADEIEKGYQGTKNFLDKSCPIPVRNDGIRELDGSRYSFLQSYPWSLQYEVGYKPFEALSTVNAGGKNSRHKGKTAATTTATTTTTTTITDNDGSFKRRERFFYDIREDLRAQSQQQSEGEQSHVEPGQSSSSSSAHGHHSQSTSSGDDTFHLLTLPTAISTGSSNDVRDEVVRTQVNKSSASSGPRFVRALRFECSMNFLDPKRATRNIIGRWIEGKMYHWKKVLGGGKKQASFQQLEEDMVVSTQVAKGAKSSGNGSSRKVIEVIDSILGPPRPSSPALGSRYRVRTGSSDSGSSMAGVAIGGPVYRNRGYGEPLRTDSTQQEPQPSSIDDFGAVDFAVGTAVKAC